MQDFFNVNNIEMRRQALRMPIGDFCKEVGMNPSTWEKLREGRDARLSTALKIVEVIETAEKALLAQLIALHPDHAAELLANQKRGEAA